MQGTSHIAVTAEAVSQPDISRKGVIVDGNGEEDTKQGLHCASAMSRLCSLVIPYIVRELSSDRESEVCESMGTPAAPLSLLYIEARYSP